MVHAIINPPIIVEYIYTMQCFYSECLHERICTKYKMYIHVTYTHTNTHTTEWDFSHQHHHLTELKEVKVGFQNLLELLLSLGVNNHSVLM